MYKELYLKKKKTGANNLENYFITLIVSPVNIDGCFDMRSEVLTCTNQMIFINFGQSPGYGRLERFYAVMRALTDSSPDLFSVWIQIW